MQYSLIVTPRRDGSGCSAAEEKTFNAEVTSAFSEVATHP